jgi:hypothetical protein
LRLELRSTDLTDIFHEPIPVFGDEAITLSDLVEAALLLGSLARLVVDELLALPPSAKPRQFAAPLAVSDLCDLLGHLGWHRSKRQRVISFFTYRGASYDGVWSKPLVASDEDHVIPVLSALAAPNLYRSAEVWLADAGGDQLQQTRGAHFEARARTAVTKAIEKQALTDKVAMAAPWSVKINGARQDVDLALRIGTTVFVAEAKLKRFPAAPREAGRWMMELIKGAGQAKRRTDFLGAHPQSAAQATSFGGRAQALTFRPFVLVSGFFGSGVSVDGVPVIDLDSLVEFFHPGCFPISGELRPGSIIQSTRSVPYWRRGDDLARAFAAYLQEPVRVRAIEAALKPQPRLIGFQASDGREIHITEPFVDPEPFTLAAAEQLQAETVARWSRALAGLDDIALPTQSL